MEIAVRTITEYLQKQTELGLLDWIYEDTDQNGKIVGPSYTARKGGLIFKLIELKSGRAGSLKYVYSLIITHYNLNQRIVLGKRLSIADPVSDLWDFVFNHSNMRLINCINDYLGKTDNKSTISDEGTATNYFNKNKDIPGV